MKPRTTLRDTALALLKKHTTPDAAVAHFVKFLTMPVNSEMLRALALDFLIANAPKQVMSRRLQGPRRRPRPDRMITMPTDAQRKANISVERRYAHAIFARKLRGGKMLGNVTYNELRAHAEQSADAMMEFLARGYEDAVDFFGCMALAHHVTPVDPFKTVKEIFKAETVVAIYDQARLDAVKAIEAASAKAKLELIAAATAGKPIEIGPS
jgi:hypothetical protein